MLAAAVMAALPVGQALADPPVASKVLEYPTNIAPVPRAMPQLQPYWDFDPPKHPLFDLSKFTISGDARVRAETRHNANFGQGGTLNSDTFVQQWARLGLNYAISQDVDMFTQLQYSHNWGGNTTAAGGNANDSSFQTNHVTAGNSSVGVRQAFIMIRNFGIDGLSLKVGRQLMVMGNHRLFGHFDWNNQAFSHDGVTFQYNQPTYEVWGGWLHAGNSDAAASGASAGAVTNAATSGGANADILFTRLAFKPIAGLAIEPLWVWMNNKTGPAGTADITAANNGAVTIPHAPGQSRHTLGGRVAYRSGMFDGTAEAYWQTGHFDMTGGNQNVSINAVAMAYEAGITLQNVPTTPRIGAEFNYASGDNSTNCQGSNVSGCQGNANTFENLYPTNHIVMGYADRMAWRNMVGYSGSLQLNPTQSSHLETRYWIFRKANSNDCWYTASQACQSAVNTTSNSLYKELDVIYTLFFKNNKVAWQTGFSYLWAGRGMDQIVQGSAGNQGAASNSTWGYTQLQVNF
ncbi:MAG: alginate export family protein [Nitrospira sp.]